MAGVKLRPEELEGMEELPAPTGVKLSPDEIAGATPVGDAVDEATKKPSLLREIGTRAGEVAGTLWGGVKAIGSSIAHPIDTATDPAKRRELVRGVDDVTTLGYGRKLADNVVRALSDPTASRDYDPIESFRGTMASTEAADAAAAPGFRTAGNIGGLFTPGAVSTAGAAGTKVAEKLIAGPGLAKSTARGVLGYEATAPVVAGLHADAEGHRLEAAGEVARDPIGLAFSAAAGGGGHTVKSAPARAAASEVKGLTEGVQYKTRITKFDPSEAQITKVLGEDPKIRSLIKENPVKAEPLVDKKIAQVAEDELAPFYRQMKKNGTDGLAPETVTNQLKAARAEFHDIAEEGQVAVIDRLIEKFDAKAKENGGTLPAEYVREAATSFQRQGFASVPMIGQVPLAKEMKRAVGTALREAIADHIEALPDTTASGKALRTAFRDANKRVATWSRIGEIVEEKAVRVRANASPMGDLVSAAGHLVNHPVATALSMVPKAADVADRRVLAPLVRSRLGEAMGPGAERVTRGATLGAGGLFGRGPRVTPVAEETPDDIRRRTAMQLEGDIRL